jgi:Type VI secretion system/phage-baseplate injector OB domain
MTRTRSGCFGKYRGKVEKNLDPMRLGRLQVSCPAVLGDGSLSWALPSTPYAGPSVGLFLLPPVGANVWVEFEGGDPDYPIWSGCFWGTGQVPASPATENIKMLKTRGVSITINDAQNAGGFTMVIASPSVQNQISLKCDTNGVELTIGDAKLTMTTEDIVTNFGEDASTRLSGDGLELAGKENTSVFNEDGIAMTGAEHTVTFSESGIEMVASESSVNLTEDSIEAVNGNSNVTIASDSVAITGDSSEGTIGSSGVELTDGSGTIKLASGKLSVNDGALEVQ